MRTVLALAALVALAACQRDTEVHGGVVIVTQPSLTPPGSDSLAADGVTADPSTDCPGLMMTDSDLPDTEIEVSDEEWDDWYRENMR